MDFSGWEKLSLVDFDDHITTTLFTSGCNFRCPFCHNGPLVLCPKEQPTIPWAEILAYLKKRQGVLDAVCVSGGEPTLMDDLEDKLRQIKELGYLIKLDSNGSRPDLLKRFVDEKLVDYIAMDIKNSKARYAETIGLKKFDLAPIEQSVSYLLEGHIPYEFRTTMMEEFHDEESFKEIAIWIKGAKRYFLQRYIDADNCIEHGFHEVPLEKAKAFLELCKEGIPNVALRGYSED